MVFPVVMYGCGSWTTKKAERRRIDAFELWCWKRLLRVPWTARRSNQSILKEISPEYSSEVLTSLEVLHWKDWFIGNTEAETPILWPPDARNWLIGKDPDAGKDWRQEEKRATEDEMVGWHHRLDGHEFEQALEVGDRQGSLACCNPWSRRVRHNWATELKTDLFDLLAVQGTSGVFSSTTVWRHQFFGILPSLQSSSHSHTWPLGRL